MAQWQRTASSPQMMFSTRPLGTTCAISPSLTLSLPSPLGPSCTFKASTSSGFILPPPRNWLKSWVSFSMALRICDSRPETSYASSVGVAAPVLLTGGALSLRPFAALPLPPFLCRGTLREKLRAVWESRFGVVGPRQVLRALSEGPPDHAESGDRLTDGNRASQWPVKKEGPGSWSPGGALYAELWHATCCECLDGCVKWRFSQLCIMGARTRTRTRPGTSWPSNHSKVERRGIHGNSFNS